MLQTYVQFYYPSLFVSETSERPVSSRRADVQPPKGAYGHRFYDIEEAVVNGETLRGKPKNHSGMTYYGKAMTLAEVKAMPGDHRILISNMEANGWKRVVKTVRGNFQPLEAGDVVV